MADAPYSNQELNRFWLRELAECSLITYNSLSPDETELTSRAKAYADRLDALALRADKSTDADEAALNRDAFQIAQELRKFFIYILSKITSENLHVDVKTTAVSSFASQTEKYMDALHAFMNNLKPQFDPIEAEVFWLDIFTNMCRYVSDNLGNFQKRYRDKAQELAQTLNESWSFSVELQIIVSQVNERRIPLAQEHHQAVYAVLREMYEFITTIIRLQRETRIPGSLSLVYLSRIQRLLCFFLVNGAKALKDAPPDCSPYAPRISNY